MKKILVLIAFALLVGAPSGLAVSGKAQGQISAQTQNRLEKATEIQTRVQELKAAREEQRAELKTQLLGRVQAKAIGEIDRIVARYEKIKTRVQNMNNIDEALKVEVADRIDLKAGELTLYKEKITAATTVEEVRDLMKALRTDVRKNANVVKEVVMAIHKSHYNSVVTKLTAIAKTLEEKGGDATLLATANTKLAEATETIKAGNFKTAKEQLLAVRKTLIEVMQKLNGDTVEKPAEIETTETTEQTTVGGTE